MHHGEYGFHAAERVIGVAHEPDWAELAEVMYDAVRNGPSPYTEEQRRAWLPEPHSEEAWQNRLSGQFVVQARAQGRALGFLTLTPQGHVDLAFIRPAAQGQGLFRGLYAAIEAAAVERGLSQLTVDASLAAQPAFAAVGFTILAEETVAIRGQHLRRYHMQKQLVLAISARARAQSRSDGARNRNRNQP